MQSLRTESPWGRLLVRLVLAWFALALGAAVVSPVVKPQSVEMICSAAGHFKLLVKNVDGDLQEDGASRSATLDCPLCTGLGGPLPPTAMALPAPDARSHALHPLFAAHIAALTAPPLPSRGPPALA